MADVKISQLPLATAVHADDTLEKSDHNAAPSQRCTPLQIMTYLQTAFPSLSWASGVSNLQPNGDIFVGAGNLAIINAADGSATFGATKIQLNSDGSAVFASPNINFAADGSANFANNVHAGGGIHQLNVDGSANFSSSIVTISAADGSLTVDNGFGSIVLDSSDSSVSAVSVDAANINASTAYSANGTPGIDQDITVQIDLTTQKVMHFQFGLLVSVTDP